jgi:hypothetical protein
LLYENQSYLSSYLISKERHGYRRKNSERIKEQKALVFKKRKRKRERECEKKNVAIPSQKKLEKENFPKEYHFHQIYHTHAHLDQCV